MEKPYCLDCAGSGRVLTARWGLLVRKYGPCPACAAPRKEGT